MNRGLAIALILGLLYLVNRQSGLITMKDIENGTQIMTTGSTRGERNNNPGNIRPAGYTWQGQIGTDCGSMGCYIKFSTPVMGIRAVARDLLTKFNRGLTNVQSIIYAYAPPGDNNDSGAYARAVAGALGVSVLMPIDMNNLATHTAFVYAVIKHENGRVIYSPAQIAEGVALAR